MSHKIHDPGIGTQFNKKAQPLINNDGSYNIERKGKVTGVRDFFKYLIDIPWFKFFLLIFGFYLFLNLLFTIIYVIIGYEHITGINEEDPYPFLKTFFFSVHTFTTVGYGTLAPKGLTTQFVAAAESFTGFLSFSVATGLLYGRFSKPKSKIIYSDHILYSKYKSGYSLKARVANLRDSVYLDVHSKFLVSIDKKKEDGTIHRVYYDLPLEMKKIEIMVTSWTIVHEINNDSPFYGKTKEEIETMNPSFILLIKGFDELFSQHTHSRRPYTFKSIIWNKNYKKMFYENDKGKTVLDIHSINDLEDE